MLSLRSTETEVTSPSTQSLGIVGQVGSTVNSGGRRADCEWASSPIEIARASTSAAHGGHRNVVCMDRDDTPASRDRGSMSSTCPYLVRWLCRASDMLSSPTQQG